MRLPPFLDYSLRISFGVAALIFVVQYQALAQTAMGDNSVMNDTTSMLPLRSVRNLEIYPPIPVLPPIPEPVLPESASQIHLALRLKERKVYVYRDSTILAVYSVAIGKPGWETPTGSFRILAMQQNPGWINPFTREIVPPSSDNPMGERVIAFWTDGQDFIGFHGTPNRESVGQAASHGCVRMYNEDIREMYGMLTVGTTVVVEP